MGTRTRARDNLVIEHKTGPLVQDEDYYAFGLTMAGISSKAAGKTENKKKYNGIEFNDDLDLDTYEAFYRNLDPQTGRWWQIDPKCEAGINSDISDEDESGLESLSPYNSMGNDPVRYSDPKGDLFGIDNLIGASVGAAVDYGTQVATNYATGQANPWTNNINLTSITTSAIAGGLTSGTSVFQKIIIKTGVAVVNNTVEVKTSSEGLKVKVETNPLNIAKNATIDLATDRLVKSGGSQVAKQLSKVGINNGTVAKAIKTVVKSTGTNITRKTNNVIKATAKVVVKQTNNTVQNVMMGVISPSKDKVKDKTDIKN